MLRAEDRAPGPQVARGHQRRERGCRCRVLDVPVEARREPSSCRTQSTATSSSSVAAGEVRQSIAFTFRAAVRNSARIPGSLPEIAKYAKKRGWFQCVIPGEQDLVEVVENRGERLRPVGRRVRESLFDPARLELGEHRELAETLQIARDPLGRGRGVVAEGTHAALIRRLSAEGHGEGV
jgi:hypothetical protein